MAVRKLRIIPRRKLKSTYSQRSAIYMQVGKEYVRHVSSLVKTGMTSLKLASFPVTSEGLFSSSCVISTLVFNCETYENFLHILQ